MKEEEQLYCTVRDMFMRFGIKSVSMDDISRALGISKKTLYQVVENKEDLIKSTIENIIAKEDKIASGIRQNAENALDEMITIAKHVTELIRMMTPTTIYDLKKYYKNQFQYLEKSRNQMIKKHVVENIKRGMKEGLYRNDLNPDMVATIYLKMVSYIIDESLGSDTNSEETATLYQAYLKYHLRGICKQNCYSLIKNLFEPNK